MEPRGYHPHLHYPDLETSEGFGALETSEGFEAGVVISGP